MKKLLSIAAMITAAVSYSAFADEVTNKPYVIVEGGLSMATSKYKGLNKKFANGGVYGVGIGLKAAENFRTDLTFNVRPNRSLKVTNNNVATNLKFKSMSVMLNGYYDFANSSDITPYLNAGIGYSRNNLSGNQSNIRYIKSKKNMVTYQVGAGVSMKVAENVNFNVGYRFVDSGKVKIIGFSPANIKGNYRNHEVIGGLQFSF
jgi:opacity protein-like surface antigen